MSARTISWRRPAGTALAAAAVTLASVPLLTAPAQAAPVKSAKTLNCQTATFPAYDWALELDVTAVTDGTDTVLTMQANNLPGVVPLDVASADMAGSIVADVNGTKVTLTGTSTTPIKKSQPVPVPPVSAKLAGSATPLKVEVKRLQYDTTAFGSTFKTLCPTGGGETSWTLPDIPVESTATIPIVTPTPTTPAPTATPTPSATTPTPTPKESGDKKGVAAKGTAKFACKLQTLGSPFDYNPTVTISGSRATADDDKVTLKASFSEIPGLAPVPIDNGEMKINAEAMIGGKKVSFASTSKVTVPTYGKVPVPTLTSTITSAESKMDVEITAFKFDFGEMSGLTVYSDCTGGGKLSAMTVGIGSVDDDSDSGSNSGSGGGSSSGSGDSGAALPKTGAAALTVIGLWSSAFVLLAVALFMFLPGRVRRTEA